MKIYDPRTLFQGNLHFASDGINVRFCCPCKMHSDRNQINASFNMVTGEYISYGKCSIVFGKGRFADLILWLRDDCGLDARINLIEKSEIELLIEKENSDWREQLSLPLAVNSDYLRKRGVSQQTIEDFDIRCDTNDSMIVYPIKNMQGKVVGTNVRYTKRKTQRYQLFGEKLPLANMDLIKKNPDCRELYITEGMFGVFNLYEFDLCSMALLGSSGKIPIEIITRYDKIYLCLDNDDAGYNKAIKCLRQNPSLIILEPNEYDEIDRIKFDEIKNDINRQAISISGVNRLWQK